MISARRFAALPFVLVFLVSATEIEIFDGSAHVICYRTSSHAGTDQLIEVINMVPGGENITAFKMPYNWKEDSMKQYPIHVVRGNNSFKAPVKIESETDSVHIKEGIQYLRERFDADLAIGLKALFRHSGHYNENTSPEHIKYLYNMRYAYQAFDRLDNDDRIYAIDCLTKTREYFPATVRHDGFHASVAANYLEAVEIVKAMCTHDQIEFPEYIQTHVDSVVEISMNGASIVEATFPDTAIAYDAVLRVGDTITTQWQANCDSLDGVYVMLHAVFNDDYYLSDVISCEDDEFGSFKWVITPFLPNAGNRKIKPSPEDCEADTIEYWKDAENNRFCIRVISSYLPETDEIYSFSNRFVIDMKQPPSDKPIHLKPTTTIVEDGRSWQPTVGSEAHRPHVGRERGRRYDLTGRLVPEISHNSVSRGHRTNRGIFIIKGPDDHIRPTVIVD